MSRKSTRKNKTQNNNGNSGNLGFETTLLAAADKLRGHMDASEYKHVVLGFIFLKYIRESYDEVALRGRFHESVIRINPIAPQEALEKLSARSRSSQPQSLLQPTDRFTRGKTPGEPGV